MAVPGTHVLYGATGGDFIGSGQSGGPLTIQGGITLMVWTLAGVQVTDLYDESEDPATVVVSDDFGNYRFFAPKDQGPLMVSVTAVSTRYAVFPVEFTSAAAALAAAAVAQSTADGKLSQAQADPLYVNVGEAISGGNAGTAGTALQHRSATAASWTATNPVLRANELGIENDTNKIKVGNGTAAWTTLPYVAAGGTGGVTASTDLTDSALLLRTTGSALKTAGVHTYNLGTIEVAADEWPLTATAGLVTALAGKATTALLAKTPVYVFNYDGSDPVRPNTSATGQFVIWVYQVGNAPALNGTTAGGSYASVDNVDLHLTFA